MTDYTPKSFKLDSQLAAELEDAAKREERTQTAILERALREYFARTRAVSEASPNGASKKGAA